MNIIFTIRLKHKDTTDKLSHEIIDDLEKSNFQLHKIKWKHQ